MAERLGADAVGMSTAVEVVAARALGRDGLAELIQRCTRMSVKQVRESLEVRRRFNIAPGEKAAIVGPNGVGKSTMVNALTGAERATGGVNAVTGRGRIVRKFPMVLGIDLAGGTEDQFRNEPEAHYSVDWFHPGAGGYKLWAEVMYPTVLQVAERPD